MLDKFGICTSFLDLEPKGKFGQIVLKFFGHFRKSALKFYDLCPPRFLARLMSCRPGFNPWYQQKLGFLKI
jgi:hypothetical protein